MTDKQKTITRIHTEQDLAVGIRQLLSVDPTLLPLVKALPPIPLRNRTPGFEGLAEIITAQQVSKASASAIFSRMKTLIPSMDAASFLAAGEAPLIEAGQSRSKQATLRGLAQAVVDDQINLEALCDMPAQEAMDQLTTLRGIGPWTAEVFLLFCAGHADIFPAGDIALQQALTDVFQLDERPDINHTRQLAKRWAPLQGVAARVLYAHYARSRGKSAI